MKLWYRHDHSIYLLATDSQHKAILKIYKSEPFAWSSWYLAPVFDNLIQTQQASSCLACRWHHPEVNETFLSCSMQILPHASPRYGNSKQDEWVKSIFMSNASSWLEKITIETCFYQKHLHKVEDRTFHWGKKRLKFFMETFW